MSFLRDIAGLGAWAAGTYVGYQVGGPGTGAWLGATLGGFFSTTAFQFLWPLEAAKAKKDSSTYGWEPYRNATTPGSPIPVVYGAHKIAPPIISSIVSYDLKARHPGLPHSEGGDIYDLTNKSKIDMDLLVSEGPINAISGIKLDGNAVAEYTDVTAATYLGTSTQSPAGNLAPRIKRQIINNLTIASEPDKATPPQPFTGFTTSDEVTDLYLNFEANESFYMTEDNKLNPGMLDLKTRYRVSPDGEWSKWAWHYIWGQQMGAARFGFWLFQGLDLDTYDVEINWWAFYPSHKVLKAGETFIVDPNQTLTLLTSDEYIASPHYYSYSAIVCLRGLATEKLHGSIPTVTCEIEGRKLRWYNGTAIQAEKYADGVGTNPAWIILDILTSKRYGAGAQIADANINLTNFKSFADYCDAVVDGAARHTCSLVIDFSGKVQDLANEILASYNAHLIFTGGKYEIRWEAPLAAEAEPAAVFGMGNIVRGSFSQSWAGRAERFNLIEISFMNADDDWERNVLNLRASEVYSSAPAEPERKLSIELLGVTRQAEVLRFANRCLRKALLTPKAIEFAAAREALGLEEFDVIGFSHDHPTGMGWSGRISNKLGDDKVVLDQVITLAGGGAAYKLVIWLDDNTVAEADIETGASTTDTITYDDAQIDHDDFTAGRPYIIYEVTAELKQYRVCGIDPGADLTYKITALEYNDEVYTLAEIEAPTVRASASLPIGTITPPAVTGLTLSENPAKPDSILVGFAPDPNYLYYAHFEIQISTDNVFFSPLLSVTTPPATINGLMAGRTYYIGVVAYNKQDNSSTRVSAQINFTGNVYWRPPDVTGLEIFGQGNDTVWQGRDVKFRWNRGCLGSGADFDPDELSGGGSGYQEAYFGGYVVSIESLDDNSNWKERRSEHLASDNFYTYTYEKNREDHAGSARNQIRIKVWEITKASVLSAHPAELTVTNPAPARPTGVVVYPAITGLLVKWSRNLEADLDYYRVWASQTASFTPAGANLVCESSDVKWEQKTGSDETWYFRVAAVDTFGNESDLTDEYDGTTWYVESYDIASDQFADTVTINMLRGSDFEDDDALKRWAAGNCAMALVAGQGVAGSQALRLTKVEGGTDAAVQSIWYIDTEMLAAPGKSYVATLSFKSSDGVSGYLTLKAYTENGDYISDIDTDTFACTSSFQKATIIGVAPALTYKIALRVGFAAATAAAKIMDIDRIIIHCGQAVIGWCPHAREFVENVEYEFDTTEVTADAITTPTLMANAITAKRLYAGDLMAMRICAENLRTDTAVITSHLQVAEVDAATITLGKLQSADGLTYFDLDKNIFVMEW